MYLIVTDVGADYLSRSEGNRDRVSITNIVFGSAAGYTAGAHQNSITGNLVSKRFIDSLELNGDILTIKVFLDENEVFNYGEVGLMSADGILIAVESYPTVQRKIQNSAVELTYTIQHPKLQEALTRRSSRAFNLVYTRTDFDDAKLQLQAVASEKDNFSTIVANETGNTLIELLAGVVDHDSYMAESAFQETLPHTAKLDSSIYAIQLMLKNRLNRKRPASVSVRLARDANLPIDQIPPYSSFIVDGVLLFNREAIVWKRLERTKDVVLFQGEVFSFSIQGTGKDYQFWKSPHANFEVSDSDINVRIGRVSIPVVQNGLWEHKGQQAVQDFTYTDGSLILTFGNSTYGTLPLTTNKVSITYAITQGAAGNRSGFRDKTGELTGARFPTKVITLSELTGGGDNPPAQSYANFGGDLFGAQRGAVTPAQYRALARTYPGVNDAIVLAQRDLAPMDKDWFNTGKIILLTESEWSDTEIRQFEAWYRKRTWYGMRWIITVGRNGTEPKKRLVDIRASIYCKPTADLPTIQRAAEDAIKALFKPKQGILARPVYRSDIMDALKATHPEYVDYIVLDTPTGDTSMYLGSPPNLRAQIINGGNLPLGSYRWAVTAKDSAGESRVAYVDAQVTRPNSSVKLTWDASVSATSYIIYGRSDRGLNDMGKLHETTALTWTDNGTGSGTNEKPPSINTSGVHYGAVGNLTINVDYSNRSAVEESGYGL